METGLARRAREGLRLVPATLRRPRLALRWLAGARAAQVTGLALGLLLHLALPAVLGPALDRIYPPTEQKIIKILPFTSTRPDPRHERRRRQVTALAWSTAASWLCLLLLARLPAAMAAADQEARRREQEADSCLSFDPARSLRLYQSALGLVTDPGRELALREKSEAALGEMGASARATAETLLEDPAPTLRQGLPPPDPRRIGGRYQLKEELARGGMGIVHRAVDDVLGRDVALKELPQHLAGEPGFVERFQREARVLAQLAHPNIVQVYDLVADRGRLWMVMELVEGGNLADRIDIRGALPWREALETALPVARALGFAHERGVLHRDVKPMNVLLASGGTPKVTDFGLAKLVESSLHTRAGALLGSPRYMSPEQAEGRPADARSDIYAFGITLYEMVAGRAPFTGEMASVLAQQLKGTPPPLGEAAAGLPARLEGLVMSMLAKNPDERPQSFASVVRELEQLAAPQAGGASSGAGGTA